MSRPYRLTCWQGAFYDLGAFEVFTEALKAYRECTDSTKQLINEDLADSGRDGLSEDERDAVAAVSYAEELAERKAAS